MDVLKGMKKLKDKSINLAIIDPPYYKIMLRDHKGNKFEWDDQWNDLGSYQEWIKEISMELQRILKDDGCFYVFADHRISAYVQIIFDNLFKLENSIVWHKPNNLPNKGWKGYNCFTPLTERILFYSNRLKYPQIAKYFNQTKNYTDVWVFNIIGGKENLNHPTQKPLKLIRRMVMVSSKPDDLVLDLFSGTGTTAVASKQLDRNYIGFEQNLKYIEIANKRLSQDTLFKYEKIENGTTRTL